MSSSPALLIIRYIRAYCKFHNSDIESTVIEDRNFEIIFSFLFVIGKLLDKNVTREEALEKIKQLEYVVEDENTIFNSLDIYACDKLLYNKISPAFEKTKESIKDFIEAYDHAYDSLNVKRDDRKIQDLLVEFNNTLAHILTAVDHESDGIITNINIDRANNHLYRGSVDAYKEVIRKNNAVILEDKVAHKQLENKTMYEFYLYVRKNEALKLGRDSNSRGKILEAYRKLSWMAIN